MLCYFKKEVLFTLTSYWVISPLGHSGGIHVKVTQLALFADKVTDLGAFCGPIKIIHTHRLFKSSFLMPLLTF